MTTVGSESRYCMDCGKDLFDEIEGGTYSAWEVDGTGAILYAHEGGICDGPTPSMSYYNKCECCKIEFDISKLDFDVDDDKNTYCSIDCRKRHFRVCLRNVEEPDIVY